MSDQGRDEGPFDCETGRGLRERLRRRRPTPREKLLARGFEERQHDLEEGEYLIMFGFERIDPPAADEKDQHEAREEPPSTA